MIDNFNPILNNPFEGPSKYYATTLEGTLTCPPSCGHKNKSLNLNKKRKFK